MVRAGACELVNPLVSELSAEWALAGAPFQKLIALRKPTPGDGH